MRQPEVRDIYSIEDLFEPTEKTRLAQVGFAALRKAGLIKKPTLQFADNDAYQHTPITEVDKTVTLPLALIGFAIEKRGNTQWIQFFERAVERLRKTGIFNKPGDTEVQSASARPQHGPLITEHETLTYIVPKTGPSIRSLVHGIANKIFAVITQSQAAAAAAPQKPLITPAPTATPAKPKPEIYSKLQAVPEYRNGELEKIVAAWAQFYSELYGKTIRVDDIEYQRDVKILANKLFLKPAAPLVHVERAHHNRGYLGHLINQATSFGVNVVLDASVPLDDVRYPTENFWNFPKGTNPTVRTANGIVFYDDARKKELVAYNSMRDNPKSSLLFIQGYEMPLSGATQYQCIDDLASLDDVVAAFVFSGWAAKNNPSLGQTYFNTMPNDARIHTATCTANGRAITAKRTKHTTLRISDFSPTERLRHGVMSI